MKKIFLLLTYLLIFNNQQLYSQCTLFTPVAGSPFPSIGANSATFSPLIGTDTLFAATTNKASNIGSSYRVNITTGSLTPTSNPSFTTGNAPTGLAFSPLTPLNTLFAALANANDNTISVYKVDINTGDFTQIGLPIPVSVGPQSVAFSPLIGTSTLFAAVATVNAIISVFSVDISTGQFTLIQQPSSGAGATSIAFSPLTGTNTLFAATANSGASTASVYNVNTTTGIFTQVTGSPFPTGISPDSIAFSPLIGTALFAAVVNEQPDNGFVYTVNTTSGRFTEVTPPFTTGSVPASLAYAPLIGTTLYAAVANNQSNNVSLYTVNTSTGRFAAATGSPFSTGNGPFSVAFSPLLNVNTVYAIVANQTSGTLSVFRLASLEASISPAIQVACENGVIQLNASVVGGQAPYTYEWTGPNGFSESTGNNPTLTIQNPTSANTGDYFVTITDSLDCQGSSITSKVVVSSCI